MTVARSPHFLPLTMAALSHHLRVSPAGFFESEISPLAGMFLLVSDQ